MNRDVLWSALEAMGAALFSLTGAFVIARLIGPAELGLGAAAAAVHVLLWVAVNALFADAIVQRATIDDTILSSAAWASTATGCGAALAQAGMGGVLAWMLDEPRLAPMALALAVPLPFVGMAGAYQGLLTRQRRYGVLAARTLAGQGAGMVLGIALATHHAGAWAVVAQQAASSLIAALVLIGATGWWPRPVCRWSAVRDLLRTGLPLTASTLTQIGRYRLFALLIGATAGPAALGQVHVAFRLADTARDLIFTALWRLMLPILSAHQHDRDRRLAEVDRLSRLSGFVTLPFCGGLVLALVPLTTLILGPAWREAGAAALPLAGLMALLALMFPSGVALAAAGGARFTLFANLAGLAATLAFVPSLRPETPWEAVLAWCAAQLFISPYSLWVNGRALGVGPFRPLRAGLPALLVTLAGVGTALALDGTGGPLETLIRRGGVFALVVILGFTPLLWRMGGAPWTWRAP